MALLLDPSTRGVRADRPWVVWFVPGVALAGALARLPFLALPPGPDEAGFLQVAAQWSPGPSLYGSYWVDRPPLLLALFRIAALHGGIATLRVMGCAAVAATVLLCAWAARHAAGPAAARWAALAAASLLVTPLTGATEVNGELLAAPFVALGLGAGIKAFHERSARTSSCLWAAVAGGSGCCAILVKQNIADVAVFCGTLAVTAVILRRLDGRACLRLALSAGLGAAVSLLAVSALAVSRGTSLLGVYDALYPFRLRAARAVAAAGGQFATVRVAHTGAAWVGSGLALLCAVLLLAVIRARLRDPVLVALALTVAFDALSIALGGSYWRHYLIEMIVPLAVSVGLVSGNRRTPTWSRAVNRALMPRLGVALCCISAAASILVVATRPPDAGAEAIGDAVRAASHPGDTLTTLYGEPQVNLASGLPSPYPYLWSLPIKTLDPRLDALDTVLAGPHAPTWLVTFGPIPSWGLDTTATVRLVVSRYHRVMTYRGQTVYLHNGTSRGQVAPPRGGSVAGTVRPVHVGGPS